MDVIASQSALTSSKILLKNSLSADLNLILKISIQKAHNCFNYLFKIGFPFFICPVLVATSATLLVWIAAEQACTVFMRLYGGLIEW